MPLVDRQTILFFIIMFIFLSLPSGIDQPHSNKDRETLDKFHASIRANREDLAKSEYYEGYGNLTGFKLSYQDNLNNLNELNWPFHEYNRKHPFEEKEEFSILPNEVSNRVKQFWSLDPINEEDSEAYMLNISGKVYGDFEVIKKANKIKPYAMPLPKYLQEHYELYSESQYKEQKQKYEANPEENPEPTEPSGVINKVGNITFNLGKISLGLKSFDYNYKDREMMDQVKNITADSINDAVVVKVKLNLIDYPEINDNEVESLGVYFQKTGSLISISRSAKFLGNYGLSYLTMDEEKFNITKKLIGQLVNTTNFEKDLNMDYMNSYIEKSQGQCEYISYFQFDKTEYLKKQLAEIDEELMNPSGRPIPHEIPKLSIKESLLYSPDCGIILQSKPQTIFEGNKTEVTNFELKKMLSGLLILIIIQLFLLVKQLKEMKTPGQLSNVSSTTISIISLQDALMALLFLLISNLIEELYLLLACVAVIAFLMCGVFGLKFLLSVMTVQSNETGTTWWEIMRGSREEGLPLPVTQPTTNTPAATQAQPVTAPLGNDESTFANRVFGTGCILTILSTFLILNSFLWRITFRRIFEYGGLLLINSYWIPQFSRNTLKNRRKSFSWEFIWGTSMIRIIPVWYLSLIKHNPLRHHYDPVLVIVLTLWILLQIGLLYLQQIFGARFWINEKWLPQAYDYHYLLNIKDLETGKGFLSDMLNNLTSTNDLVENNGIINCKVDCAICMNNIEIPINTNADGKNIHQLDKSKLKEYMITPCHHIFHSECLEDWMVYKLQCPVCRTGLPPV
ncbi:hypothetical protein HYPBUDRAFT_152926 [Hyphopichia burtonii NRRL Y-1933]|uniref:RING-type E3 ubiquitin transferase n=1 Tax=Hyphopichia burtonii NRRL Y-1933 TaxID=984485 RepID=A0A1E4RI68_9ASCO|nr:hypothetical protein HYPBUDRAFT_152926 [Hyphopichia burtonii NRRL Y-1933]ODV66926.1 hypothetical protein HYPBUDRAFT_152926 [Hyphopichia burtonii NRRL Y-1933]